MKKCTILSVLFFCFVVNIVRAQNHTYWKWTRGPANTTSNQWGIGICADADKNIYEAGNFEDDTLIFGNNILTVPGSPTLDVKLYVVKYDSLGNVQWAHCAYGNAYGLCTDTFGNVFLTGTFISSSITFGSTTIHNPRLVARSFLVKYNAAGAVLWAREVGDTLADVYASSVAADAAGNVYVTGSFDSARVILGNDTLRNPGPSQTNMLVAKYDPAGNVLWARGAGQTNNESGIKIAAGTANNIYVTGYFNGPTMAFDSANVLTNNGLNFSDNFYVAKYTSAGQLKWAKSFGGTGNAESYSITTDAVENIYMTGNFNGPSITFDTTVLTVPVNPAYSDFFVVKFDSACHTIWARKGAGNINYTVGGIAVDSAGNVFMSGQFYEPSIVFGSDTVYNIGDQNFFITKYDPMGQAIWSRSAGGTIDDYVNNLAIDKEDHVYITGFLTSPTVAFGNDTIRCGVDTRSVYVARLDDSCARLYPPINTTAVLTIDSGAVDTLTVAAAGTISWYSADTGGTYLGSGPAFITPALTDITTYYVQDSTPCGVSARTPVTVIVTYCTAPLPPIDISDSSRLLVDSNTVDTLTVTGNGIISWYSADTSGRYLGSGNSYIIFVSGDTTLYVQDSTCEASTRTVIKIGVRTGPVGISGIAGTHGIIVAPNPTTGIIYFRGTEPGYNIEVYNMLGQIIHSSIAAGDQSYVNLAGQAKGMYFYQVRNKTGVVQTGKLVME